MVRQDSRRFLGIDFAEAARPQVPGETIQRHPFPDEAAISRPRDKIDMHVDLGDAGRGPSRAPRLHA